MEPADRVRYGAAAVHAGAPCTDPTVDLEAALTEALTNVRYHCYVRGVDFDQAAGAAYDVFADEVMAAEDS